VFGWTRRMKLRVPPNTFRAAFSGILKSALNSQLIVFYSFEVALSLLLPFGHPLAFMDFK
jgi:hypothetical protein